MSVWNIIAKKRNYSNVWDLALDRDAAIGAAIILASYYRIIGPILSSGIKNVDFEMDRETLDGVVDGLGKIRDQLSRIKT